MRSIILLIIAISFFIGCGKKTEKIEELSIKIFSYKKVDSVNSYCEVSFENNSFKNYVLPSSGGIYLVSTKNGIVSYDDKGKIKGKIVSSDFVDYAGGANSNESVKVQQLINKYYESTWPSTIDLDQFWRNNFEGFVHSLLFMPKKSKQKVIIWFHAFDINKHTLTNKNSRISIISDEQELQYPLYLKKIDSLLKVYDFDYQSYKKSPYLKDSLFINK
ncbi:hypothetical protein [Chryseobacterium rhizosphaerae]|uniref:hypothetical protein n=1 Tax=Chryseobacterium rhizosphaerae TaxID=395937 RepID=UPI002358DC63|nr:hypothetical protein [Chryseobacterium rhizosphaerae]MDC8101885.1 hypothetical protein [Chryseobacterium rhizosphaerae]